MSKDASASPARPEVEVTHIVGPEGSTYDASHKRRRSGSLRRRIRGVFSNLLVGLAALVFPYLYYAYCWFVWKTSRVEDPLSATIKSAIARHGGVVTVMWHEEVFTVAFSYGALPGAVALASTSNFGRVITRMLEVCGAGVYRGGSSRGRVRRRRVLQSMIEYMDTAPECLFGLTVDGSRGPVYQMKTGAVVLAKECRAPIYVVRTWYKRKLRMPSWDRSAVATPFNRIYMRAVGPFWIDPESDEAEFKEAHEHLERELLDLAVHSEEHLRPSEAPVAPPRGFPVDWVRRWPAGQIGLSRGPHDLRPEDPPSWAKRAGESVRPKAPRELEEASE